MKKVTKNHKLITEKDKLGGKSHKLVKNSPKQMKKMSQTCEKRDKK